MLNLTAPTVRLNTLRNKLLLILLLSSKFVFAGDSVLCKINTLANYFTVDALQYVYLINSSNEIVRTDCSGTIYKTYSNKFLGTPTLIDAGNPLKILVFYPDYQTVIILDNQLSEIAELSLTGVKAGSGFQPSSICKHAGTDHIWMYDELSRKLIRFDESGNVLASSEGFDQLFDFNVVVTGLFSVGDQVYIATETAGVLVFDAYASFVMEIGYPYKVNQVTDKYILGTHDNTLQVFDKRAGNMLEPKEISGAVQVMLLGDKLYYNTIDGIFMQVLK